MRFIDLFAGLGGFHLGLARLGHECVFASEIDPVLAALYERNHGLKPAGDIRQTYDDIPAHDILCAGFPCQPFSKAGEQREVLNATQWGDLFDYVVATLRRHKPQFLMIENVPNLLWHDDGTTWTKITTRLRREGYAVDCARLSPHMFGVPQVRERAFILGSRTGLESFSWPKPTHELGNLSIHPVLDHHPAAAKLLPVSFICYLEAWQNLISRLPADEALPTFPIWAMEFGATYPFRAVTPAHIGLDGIRSFKGAMGAPLRNLPDDELMAALPPYARDKAKAFPDWKIQFIEQNRAFYRRHRAVIDPWLPSIGGFLHPASRSSNGTGKADRGTYGRPSSSFEPQASAQSVQPPRRPS